MASGTIQPTGSSTYYTETMATGFTGFFSLIHDHSTQTVRVYGRAGKSSYSSDDAVITLPQEYWPSQQVTIMCIVKNPSNAIIYGTGAVYTNGEVKERVTSSAADTIFIGEYHL